MYYVIMLNVLEGGGHLKKENKYKKSRIFSQYYKSIVETNKDLTFQFNYFSLYAYHCN